MPARQLALNVRLRDDVTFASFLASAAHEPLVAALQAQCMPEGEPTLYLFGPAGSGKSHLLQAACHLSPGSSSYLPLADLCALPAAELLGGLEGQRLLCIDDLDRVAGLPEWEEALFHLFNRAREKCCRLVFAAENSPRQLPVLLADLRSRLGWGPVFQLPVPDDAGMQAILQFRARCRGLDMPQEVSRFLVSRVPRDMLSLMRVLEALDARSLADQRALTVPFVKDVLGL